MYAQSPAEAKRAGSNITTFNRNDRNSVREEIMVHLVHAKFAPGTELANKKVSTAGKSLAEAGQSDTFSSGLRLHNKELFNTTEWKPKVLGQVLMKVQQELT